MKTQTFAALALAIALLPAASFAQEDPAADSVAARIKEITDAHEEKLAEFQKKMRAAPRKEQRAIYQNEFPDPSAAIEAVGEVVDAHPQGDAALDGITWILRHSRGQGVDAEIFSVLSEHHLNNEKLVDVIASMMRMPGPQTAEFLELAAENSEVKDVRGMAIFTRAMSIERDSSKTDEFTALLEEFVADHADLKMNGRSLAKMAEGKLFVAQNLSIGKQAPEIVGKDVDGNEMKLSDYRGKVVVIDFWGDW